MEKTIGERVETTTQEGIGTTTQDTVEEVGLSLSEGKEVGLKPILKGKLKGRDEKGRFVEGVYEGGPGRRKGEISITTAIKNKLLEPVKAGDRTHLYYLVDKMMQQALNGDPATQKLFINYTDGLPRAKIDLALEGKSIAELFGMEGNDSEN